MKLLVTLNLALMLLNDVSASTHKIILNENELLNTCDKTCDTIPTLYHRHGCTKLSGCTVSSYGWIDWFGRCDYCSCNCYKPQDSKHYISTRRQLSLTEIDLYGTCNGGTCERGNNLSRTNFAGCDRVEYCRWERNGWDSGFVRCDYCTCTCVNKYSTSSYYLKNVRYETNSAATDEFNMGSVKETELINYSNESQTLSRTYTMKHTIETSISSSHHFEAGLSITVEAGATLPGVATVSGKIQGSLKYGYTLTNGETKTAEESESVKATAVVPARHSMKVQIIKRCVRTNVQFSALKVTVYKNGETRQQNIRSVYSNTETHFRVVYGNTTSL